MPMFTCVLPVFHKAISIVQEVRIASPQLRIQFLYIEVDVMPAANQCQASAQCLSGIADLYNDVDIFDILSRLECVCYLWRI